MRITIKKLYGQAFRSFDQFSINLPEKGLCLVKGLNKETGDSSGSGKSSVVLAIAYLFGGCTFSKSELQSWNIDLPMSVGAEIDRDGELFVIERGSSGLSVSSSQGKSTGKTAEAELDKIFGLDAKMRAMTTYRGQGQDGIFLGMSDSEKKEFLTKILGLDKFEELSSDASERIKQLSNQVDVAAGVEKAVASTLESLPPLADERLTDQEVGAIEYGIQSLKDLRQVQVDKNAKINADFIAFQKDCNGAVKNEIEALRYKLSEQMGLGTPERVVELRDKLKLTEDRLAKVEASDAQKFATFEKERYQNQKLLDSINTFFVNQHKTVKEMTAKQQLLADNKCPHCKQQWASAKEECQKLAETLQAMASEDHSDKRNQLTELEQKIALKFEKSKFYAPLLEERKRTNEEIQSFEKIANEENQKLVQKLHEQESVLKESYAKKIADFKQSLMGLVSVNQSVIQETEKEISLLEKRLTNNDTNKKIYAERKVVYELNEKKKQEAQTFLAAKNSELATEKDYEAAIGRSGFLGAIFDDVLDEIASATNEILGRIANVRHISFGFESEKENKSGTIQKKIVPIVSVNGNQVTVKSGLSGGMQSALNLAVDLAVGQVCARRSGTYPGWLVLDESFDGLGRVAKETCIEMLEKFGGEDRLIVVIDHASEFQSQFSQIINVISVDGRSSIE